MVELRTRLELDAMRAAGQVVATAVAAVARQARVGARPREWDEVVRAVFRERGGVPLWVGYHPRGAPGPFPAALCVSINDVIAYGVPGAAPLQDGDLVSIECGASVEGWCADVAVSFTVGSPVEADSDLVRIARQALEDGIGAAEAGGRVGDIARAIGVVGRSAGYGIPPPGGHGIGRALRERPWVPNDGRAGEGVPLRPGMVLALGPVFAAGGLDSVRDGAGQWASRTSDGSRAARFQHTVAITENGPWVLTVP